MKIKIEHFLFTIAFLIKICSMFLISVNVVFLAINFCFVSLIIFMIIKKYSIYSYVPLVMGDFIIQSLFCFKTFGYDINSLFITCIYFVLSSGFLYFLIIDNVSELETIKQLKKKSNMSVDKGIKALENNDYDLAIELFLTAIKDHKKNYLGYMGMCNTLTKMDKKNLKKLTYYKKKCIKYAPKELKDSINNRY